jgi:protocatechuate 3,4-dioxygenase beta subunit
MRFTWRRLHVSYRVSNFSEAEPQGAAMPPSPVFRKRAIQGFILAALLSVAFWFIQLQQVRPSVISITQQAPTPSAACTGLPATVAVTEGPYFKPNSPERASLLEEGAVSKGVQLILSGSVLGTDCKPLAHAMLDFWQADADGHYDNTGYTLRGHQFTNPDGHYQLITIIPGLYPGRTEHIHVKVQASSGPVLTTQLFFPGVPENKNDGIFDESLVLPIQDSGTGKTAIFNFVINTQ